MNDKLLSNVSDYHWNEIMRHYKNIGNHSKVIEIFEQYDSLFKNPRIDRYKLVILLSLDVNILKSDKNLIDRVMNDCIYLISTNQSDSFINSRLINYFKNCNDIEKASTVFDQMRVNFRKNEGNSYTINAMMQLYLNNSVNKKCIELFFDLMSYSDPVSCTLALKACINDDDEINGNKICEYSKHNFDQDIKLLNTMISFYGKINQINKSIEIFNNIDNNRKSAVTIGAMLQSLVENGMNQKAIEIFYQNMNKINHVSSLLALKACANIGDSTNGNKICQYVLRNVDIYRDNNELNTTLIEHYGQIGKIEECKKIFDKCSKENKADKIMIGAMLKVLIDNNKNAESIQLFLQYYNMSVKLADNNKIDHVSCIFALKACINTNDQITGNKLCKCILNEKKNFRQIELLTTMIMFYGKHNQIDKAINLFSNINADIINSKNEIAMVAMMQAYIDNDMNSMVLSLFFDEKYEFVQKFQVCCLIALKACGNGRIYLDYVEKIEKILRDNFIFKENRTLAIDQMNNNCISQLITCYAKTGNIDISTNIFRQFLSYNEIKNMNLLNPLQVETVMQVIPSMISAFSISYRSKEALKLYHDINNNLTDYYNSCEFEKFQVISFMYLSLIHGCSHNGKVNQACLIFNQYSEYWNRRMQYRIENNDNGDKIEFKKLFDSMGMIISALIDAHARKGLLNESYQLLLGFEKKTDSYNVKSDIIFGCLLSVLSGCRKFNDMKMGLTIFNKMKSYQNDNVYNKFTELKESLAAASVLMSNIYAANKYYDEMANTRNERIRNKWFKKIGISETQIDGTIRKFQAGGRYDPKSTEFANENEYELIMNKLNEWEDILLNKYNFVHDETSMTRKLRTNETIQSALCRHSEKLALACAIIHYPKNINSSKNENQIIYINKNLRMCQNCHKATKLISQIEGVIIHVSDKKLTHRFDANGNCSCNDFF